jgi:hypothetical protein
MGGEGGCGLWVVGSGGQAVKKKVNGKNINFASH